jgi:hypothetical protein|tara:strand:+ start:34446 stop:34865 length:420 start_codon:yes stop_codon:yes gene_type:complete
MAKISKLIIASILVSILLLSSVHAFRTVIILNDLFVDFAVTSDNPYWINDSQIVHSIGRVNYEDDGRYILTNAVAYYNILQTTYGTQLNGAWERSFGGGFDKDVIEFYNQREQIKLSEDLDLKHYWYERKEKVFGNIIN